MDNKTVRIIKCYVNDNFPKKEKNKYFFFTFFILRTIVIFSLKMKR